MTYPILCVMPSNRKLYFKDSILTAYQRKDIYDQDECAEDDWIVENESFQVEVIDKDSNVHNFSAIEIGDFFGFTYVPRVIFLHESDLRNYRLWSLKSVCINYIDGEIGASDDNHSIEDDGNVSGQKVGIGLLNQSRILDTHAQISSMLEKGGTLDNVIVRYIPDIGDCVIGYGLFVRERVEIGTMIGEYCGILHTTAVVPSSYSLNYPSSDGNCEINASEYGNLIRFVNHSSNPNTSFQQYLHNEVLHIVCVSVLTNLLMKSFICRAARFH
jgi:hypothetical protein